MNKFEYKNLTPFKWFVLENFPFIEADFDALTEWQIFCKIGKEINKIIDSQNVVGSEMEKFSQAFIELKNYVDTFFENLDVQDEINNKLNEMAEDGTLDNIFSKLFANTVNIMDFGAKGDGVTDDSASIQNAINSLKDGEILFIPNGNYKITKQGTYTIEGYSGATVGYGLIIENKNNIKINCLGTFTPDYTNDAFNLFVLKNVTNSEINGLKGVNDIYNTTGGYNKSLLHIDICTNVKANNLYAKNIGSCCLIFASKDCTILNSKYTRTDINHKSAAAFGIYGGNYCTIDKCIGYGGTNDGDISVYTGINHKILNCSIKNSLENSDDILQAGAQGICIDAGAQQCIVSNSNVYGYYYGIDVKSNTNNIVVNSNVATKCKCGIAVRRGEINAPAVNTIVSNNIIAPNGGNGSTSLIGGYETIGIYLQDTYQANINGNNIANDYYAGSTSDFVGILSLNSAYSNEAFDYGVNIVNNTIALNTRLGTASSTSYKPAIIVKGSSSLNNKYVNIINNIIKNPLSNMTEYSVICEYCTSINIKNNMFTRKYATTGYIQMNNCKQINISSNSLPQARDTIILNDCSNIIINDNNIQGAGEYHQTIILTNCNYANISGNNYIKPSSGESAIIYTNSCNHINASNNTANTTINNIIIDNNSSPSTNITQDNNIIWK